MGWPVSGRVWAARLGPEGTGVSAALSAPGQGHPERAEGDGKGAQGVKQAENYFPHGENHSFPAGLSSGSMRKNAAPETEVHNFHTGMLYFTGGSVLY